MDVISAKKAERHEKRAQRIVYLRSKLECEQREDEIQNEIALSALVLPEVDTKVMYKRYTIDDILAHNARVGRMAWFRFGHMVHSYEDMVKILKSRILRKVRRKKFTGNLNMRTADRLGRHLHPVAIARKNGVGKHMITKILQACAVGKLEPIQQSQIDSRNKEDVENIQAELRSKYSKRKPKNISTLIEQLSRWMNGYQANSIEPYNTNTFIDPNSQPFPLPDETLRNLHSLQPWIQTWTPLDVSVPEDGSAWIVIPFLNDTYGDSDVIFQELVASHVDTNLEDMVTDITGEAGWSVIEIDLIKYDVMTPNQVVTDEKRQNRKYLNDEARMRKKRAALQNRFESLHERWSDITSFEKFYTNLEKGWQKFQKLCNGEAGCDVHLIENGIVNPSQVVILEEMQSQKQILDETRMLNKRAVLQKRFEKLHHRVSETTSFEKFHTNLDQGWQEFQKLCNI